MSGVLLVDTNIISYIFNGHSLAGSYEKHLRGQTILIAAQTVAEMRFGAYRAGWGERRRKSLEETLANCTVAYPNDTVCTFWARSLYRGYELGRPLDESDAWIAATALTLGIPLVTHNRRDFDFIPELELISEAPT